MSLTEFISNGLSGAFDMARNKSGWEDRMDMSSDAVFASFWAFPLTLPGLILASVGDRRMDMIAAREPEPLVVSVITSALLTYVIWALVLWFYGQLARRLDAGWRISPLLIAHNWATFLGNTILGLGMAVSGSASAVAVYGFMWPAVLALGLWLDWGMLRRGLGLEKDATFVTIVFIQIAAIIVAMVLGTLILLVATPFMAPGSS